MAHPPSSRPPELPEIFCDIGRALTSSLNPKEVFEQVMLLIGDYFAPRNWSLLLFDGERRRLRFEIVMGVDAEKLKRVWIERGEGIAGWVADRGCPVVVEDVGKDTRFTSKIDDMLGFVTRSVVCVPLLSGSKEVVGVIELINKIEREGEPGREDSGFTDEDMAILEAIGSFTGIGTENAFLHQQVKEMALTDVLTGIHNRLYFNEAFTREVERVRRYGHSLALLMIDVDNMKIINDTHGHLMGDRILAAVGHILREQVRQSDEAARFGGDEFVVVMPRSGRVDGEECAERIHKAVAEWNLQSPHPEITLSLSIGIHAAGPEQIDSLLAAADQQLYNVKRQRKKGELGDQRDLTDYLRSSLEE